ncbi:MAG TPA: HTH domain-containing protein [Methylomirabilota bacterium]|nr:HTH domain-containing protein [Methylomirabilota bacterium]
MPQDLLSQYTAIREALQKEKSALRERLQAINQALGEASEEPVAPENGRRGRRAGGQSLKSVIFQVLRNGPLTKDEIVQAVQREGYRFNSKNPANSMGVILYGKNPKFKRVDGKFGLPDGFKAEGPTAAPAGGQKRKRGMSAEGRRRIAEAAKKRWAAAKAAGKKAL